MENEWPYSDEMQTVWLDTLIEMQRNYARHLDKNRYTVEIVHMCCPIANDVLPNARELAKQMNVPKTTILRWLNGYEKAGWVEPIKEGRRVVYRSTPKAIEALVRAVCDDIDYVIQILTRAGLVIPIAESASAGQRKNGATNGVPKTCEMRRWLIPHLEGPMEKSQ